LVILLYSLILSVLLIPLNLILLNTVSWGNVWENYCNALQSKEWWIFLGIALIAQAAFLTVPVERAAQRPITKRSIIPLVLASSFMTTILVLGVVFSIAEVISEKSLDIFDSKKLLPLIIFLSIWLIWALIFSSLNRKRDADSLVQHSCRLLLKGSILELLIAVPAHIYVRQRQDCCAGAMTFLGIAFGIAVMIFSFGPGVYFLFVNRCKQLPKKTLI